jgi:hypothetical protein
MSERIGEQRFPDVQLNLSYRLNCYQVTSQKIAATADEAAIACG